MRAIVRREVYSDLVNVHVVEDFPPRALVMSRRVGDHISMMEWVPYAEGEMPPPLFSVPTRIAEVIATAMTEIVPALPATEDALQDARTVRDRLLSLIERWEA